MFLDLQNILDAHFSSLDLNSSQINQVFNLFYSFTIGSALHWHFRTICSLGRILGKSWSMTLLEMRCVFWDKRSGKHVKALFAWKTDGYSGLLPR